MENLISRLNELSIPWMHTPDGHMMIATLGYKTALFYEIERLAHAEACLAMNSFKYNEATGMTLAFYKLKKIN